MFFTQYSPLLCGPVPLTILCYFFQCVQAQIPRDAHLGSGQLVPASINFLHTALLRQHYAHHFPESFTWSFLHFSPPTSAKDCQHFSLLAAAWIIRLQLLTVNQRLATVLPFPSFAPLAIPLTFAPLCTTSTSSSVTITPDPSHKKLCTSCQYLLQNQSRVPVPFCSICLHLYTQKSFRFRRTTTLPLISHSNLLTVSFWHFSVFPSPLSSFSI